jgi:hypothetical protein
MTGKHTKTESASDPLNSCRGIPNFVMLYKRLLWSCCAALGDLSC